MQLLHISKLQMRQPGYGRIQGTSEGKP